MDSNIHLPTKAQLHHDPRIERPPPPYKFIFLWCCVLTVLFVIVMMCNMPIP